MQQHGFARPRGGNLKSAAVKADAADAVADARPRQRGLDRLELGVRPDEHRDLRCRSASVDQAADPCHERRQLGVGGPMTADRRRWAGGPSRGQSLRPA